MTMSQADEKNVEKFLETLFSELAISKSLPTLESMQERFLQMAQVVKTGTNPLRLPTPTFLSTDSIGIPVDVTFAKNEKRMVLASLKYHKTGPTLTFTFKNKSYDYLYSDQHPFRTGLSLFADMLAAYIKRFPDDEKFLVNQRCIAFLRAKHLALNMSLTGFAKEEQDVQMASRLDLLASADY